MENIRSNSLNLVVYEQLFNCSKTRQAEQIKLTIEQYMEHFLKDDNLELANLAAEKLKEL